MASRDMTALMLQMIKQMQEQQHVAQEMMQEQQRAADERQRQFMAALLDRRANHTPAVTRSTIEKYPPIKIDFKEFSREPEDWTTWSKVHRAQLSELGCADALTETVGDETKVNLDDFDRLSVDPDQLHKAEQAWVSLATRPILKITGRPPQEMREKTPARFFSLLQDMGAYDSWWTKITASSKKQRVN